MLVALYWCPVLDNLVARSIFLQLYSSYGFDIDFMTAYQLHGARNANVVGSCEKKTVSLLFDGNRQ